MSKQTIPPIEKFYEYKVFMSATWHKTWGKTYSIYRGHDGWNWFRISPLFKYKERAIEWAEKNYCTPLDTKIPV